MFRHSDSLAFIQYLQKTVNNLIVPLEQVQWAMRNQGHNLPIAHETISNYFLFIGHHFAHLDDKISEEEISFTEDILESLGKVNFNRPTNSQLLQQATQMINLNRHALQQLGVPPAVVLLQMYDSHHGTDFATQAKTMYFRFANAVTKTDRTISPREEESLSHFKVLLFNDPSFVVDDSPLEPVAFKTEEKGMPFNDGSSVLDLPDPAKLLDPNYSFDPVKLPDPNNHSETKNTPEHVDPLKPNDPPTPDESKGFVRVPQASGETMSLEEALEKLNSLVGLENVKKDVLQLVNFLKVQKLRKENGLNVYSPSRHMVFSGNPGTGKTTVARLLVHVYRSHEVVSKGHFIETDRAGLVAGYLGQTAIQVAEIVKSAIGGVLFIDEAYSITSNDDNWYGAEVIDTLVKLMEDNRDDLIVIVAGYTEKMKQFLESNPGLRSRFNKYLEFEDYKPEELVKIFEKFCKDSGYQLEASAKDHLMNLFSALYEARDETFGNARLARNLYETTINNQASRILDLKEINAETLSTMTQADIPTLADLQDEK